MKIALESLVELADNDLEGIVDAWKRQGRKVV